MRHFYVLFLGIFSCFLQLAQPSHGTLVNSDENLDTFTHCGNTLAIYDLTPAPKGRGRSNVDEPITLMDLHRRLLTQHNAIKLGKGNVVVGGLRYNFLVEDPRAGNITLGLFLPFTGSNNMLAGFFSGADMKMGNKGFVSHSITWEKVKKDVQNLSYWTASEVIDGFMDRWKKIEAMPDHGASLGLDASVRNYCERWVHEYPRQRDREMLEDLKSLYELTPAATTSENALTSDYDILMAERLRATINEIMADHERRKNKECGALVDSEQVLMAYLRRNPGAVGGTLEMLREKMSSINLDLSQFIRQENLADVTLDLFSTNEVCASCMPQLLYELHSGEGFSQVRELFEGRYFGAGWREVRNPLYTDLDTIDGFADQDTLPSQIINGMMGERFDDGSQPALWPSSLCNLCVSCVQHLEESHHRPRGGAQNGVTLPCHDLAELSSQNIFLQVKLRDNADPDIGDNILQPSKKVNSPKTSKSKKRIDRRDAENVDSNIAFLSPAETSSSSDTTPLTPPWTNETPFSFCSSCVELTQRGSPKSLSPKKSPVSSRCREGFSASPRVLRF